jgi:hypothetical protein
LYDFYAKRTNKLDNPRFSFLFQNGFLDEILLAELFIFHVIAHTEKPVNLGNGWVNLIRGDKIYLEEVLICLGLKVPRTCPTATFFWPIMPGVDLFNMEAGFRGGFQYGGRFWGQF